MKTFVWIVVLALAAGAGWWFFAKRAKGASGDVQYRTAKVERGELVEGVPASGTVQPVVLVQVGTQVSGVIDKLFVDFNSEVKAGQTIALLDSRRMEAQVAGDEAAVARSTADLERMKAVVTQAQADIGKFTAQVSQARADVLKVKALLKQAQQDLERQKTLSERKLIAPVDFDAATANAGSLEAQVTSAEAAVAQSEAQLASARATVQQDQAQISVGEAAIRQSQATLAGDRINLAYATIVSPVDGVVVSRNVDVGQTVAASLSAPTLFLIAQDLTKIQVQTSVPEADIGKVHKDQRVRFTVDAHPERTFDGIVSQVRLASTTVQNVVTYTVVVDASNPDGLLFPGMTADVTFEIATSKSDALHVPSTALRLQPPADLVEPRPDLDTKVASKKERTDKAASTDKSNTDKSSTDKPGTTDKADATQKPGSTDDGGARPSGRGKHKSSGESARKAFVYVVTPDNRLRAIAVRPGIADNASTVVEPLSGEVIEEGMEVVTSIVRESEPTTTNPFAPVRAGGGRGR